MVEMAQNNFIGESTQDTIASSTLTDPVLNLMDFCEVDITEKQCNDEMRKESDSDVSDRDEPPAMPSSSTGRKRTRNEATWKKNIRKINRAKGLVYQNTAGVTVVPKQFEYIDSCCIHKCFELFKEEQQSSLFTKFRMMENYNEQSAFIFAQTAMDTTMPLKRIEKLKEKLKLKPSTKTKTHESRKKYVRRYYLPTESGVQMKVCKIFFKKVLQVSDSKIDRIMKHKSTFQTPPEDKRGRHQPHNKTPEVKVKEVSDFISKFPLNESYNSKEKNNIAIMYRHYKDTIPEPVSRTIFDNVFNSQFRYASSIG